MPAALYLCLTSLVIAVVPSASAGTAARYIEHQADRPASLRPVRARLVRVDDAHAREDVPSRRLEVSSHLASLGALFGAAGLALAIRRRRFCEPA